jgi:hypothetical protein
MMQTPLKRYLTDNKVKSVWLAKEIGLAAPNLSHIVNGWASERQLAKWAPEIARVLGVPVAELFPELEVVPA